MTSKVVVTACLAPEKEVLVISVDPSAPGDSAAEAHHLQDGETREFTFYDGMEISVREVTKC